MVYIRICVKQLNAFAAVQSGGGGAVLSQSELMVRG